MSEVLNISRRLLFSGTACYAAIGMMTGSQAKAFEVIKSSPTSTPPDLTLYGQLPKVLKVALSPDGKRVALVVNKPDGMYIYDYELETGDVAAAVIEGDRIIDVTWADNKNIAISCFITNAYLRMIRTQRIGYIIDVHAGKRFKLYSNMAGFEPLIFGGIERVKVAGDYRLVAPGIRLDSHSFNKEAMLSLNGFSSVSHEAFNIDSDKHPIISWVFSQDGSLVARDEYDADTRLWKVRYKFNDGWHEIYSVESVLDRPILAGLGKDGKNVLIHFQEGSMQDQYAEITPEGKVLEPYVLQSYQCWPVHDAVSRKLVGFGHPDGIAKYVFFDEHYQRLSALITKAFGPDLRAVIVDHAEDNPLHVIVFVDGNGNPGTYYSIDFSKGGYKQIGETYPDIPVEWVSEKKRIAYKAADGVEIQAFLTLPNDREAKDLALIVMPHGGPHLHEGPGFDYLSQSLASRGYAVLQPDYRGSSGYGAAFTEKGFGEFGRKMQTDLSDGVSALVSQGLVSAKRVSIFGGAYGGYAAMAGITLQAGIYNCAASLAGISDIKSFIDYEKKLGGNRTENYPVMYWQRYLGDEKAWDDISPIKHIDKITVPLLLLHGDIDTIVLFEQSQKMHDAMKWAGKSVELITLNHEIHALSSSKTNMQTVKSVVEFMLKHNPPA